MKITAIDHGLNLSLSFGPQRTPGMHMSDLIGAYYAALEPKRYAKQVVGAREPKERWGLGMALEETLEWGFIKRLEQCAEKGERVEQIERPGEFETYHTSKCPRRNQELPAGFGCKCGGGIIFSPDVLIYNGNMRVGEIKLNSMSARGVPWKLGKVYDSFDAKFDKFQSQLMIYCFHLETLFGRLYSFSVREMVNFNENDIFRAWDIDYKEHELAEAWKPVLMHANSVGMLR